MVMMPCTWPVASTTGRALICSPPHHLPGIFQGDTGLHGHGRAGHDVRAAQLSQRALERGTARHVQQPRQVGAADVEHLVVVRQGGIQVFGRENPPSPSVSGSRLRRILRMGVAATGQVVVDNARQQQNAKTLNITGKAASRATFLRGVEARQTRATAAPGGVQTAQRHHHQHGQRQRPAAAATEGSGTRAAQATPTKYRQGISSQHRPWLRQGAGRHAKHQHGTGAQRRNHPVVPTRAGVPPPAAQQCRQQHAQGDTDGHHAGPFALIDTYRSRPEIAQPADRTPRASI